MHRLVAPGPRNFEPQAPVAREAARAGGAGSPPLHQGDAGTVYGEGHPRETRAARRADRAAAVHGDRYAARSRPGFAYAHPDGLWRTDRAATPCAGSPKAARDLRGWTETRAGGGIHFQALWRSEPSGRGRR